MAIDLIFIVNIENLLAKFNHSFIVLRHCVSIQPY